MSEHYPGIRVKAQPEPRVRLRVIPRIPPLEVEMQNTGTVVQWRVGTTGPWQDLITIDSINASVSVGDVVTLPPGSPATVENVGTEQDVVLDFGIPEGIQGDAATITIGSVSAVAYGQPPTVTNVGTPQDAILDFEIPDGEKGDAGDAATIAVGTVTTLTPGAPATVTNVGTADAAIFNFGIPQGTAGGVTSVNGATGVVVLDADDIDDTSTTNKFASAAELTKLSGIEAGADVTDAANVAAAGAVMEGDTSTSAMSFVVDEDDMASDSPTKVPTQQSVKAYVDANGGGGGGGAGSLSLALALSEAMDVSIATGEMFADGFGSLGMVDDAGATNCDTSEAGYLKPSTTGDTYATSADPTLGSSASAGAQTGNTIRQRIAASALSTSGDRVKLTFKASANGPTTFNVVYCGHAGTGANFDGTQVPVTFNGGSASVTISAGATVESDPVTYSLNEATDFMVAMACGTASTTFNSSATGYTDYIKAGSDASATTGTGYSSTASRVLNVDRVSVRTVAGATNDITVESEVIPTAFVPASVSGELRVLPTDALTLNTDIMLDVTRDGSTWHQVTLADIFHDGGIYVLRFDAVDLSGDPSDDAPQWRLRSDNGKRFKADGVALEFRE